MRARIESLLAHIRGSDTGQAAGLALAMIVNNVIALGSSVAFARLVNDYGALAALISYLVILTVVGQALQVATAREGVLGHLGTGEQLLDTLERWATTLAVFTLLATIVSCLLRQQIADLVGVHNYPWAAALGVPGGCMYLGVCILRGALQAISDYRSVGLSLVGEQAVRLIAGSALAVIGLGVTGAYLGSLISYVAMSVYCGVRLYGQLAPPGRPRWRFRAPGQAHVPFWSMAWGAAIPILALGIVQLLQNVDLITAKHQFSNHVASSYAVAAVAAKVLIWIAMGASFYLVPETSRRRAEGRDTRPVLLQCLGIIVACAIPCLLIFAVAAHPLLAAVFGTKRAIASDALVPLAAAFTVLAMTYLAVQYLLALKRVWFLLAIGLVALLEPVLLSNASRNPESFAAVVLVVQLIGAVLIYTIALAAGRQEQRTPPVVNA